MSMRPAPGMYPVSQGFWGTFSTRFSGGTAHGAIDIACPSGTPLLAPDDGVIVFADWAWNLPGGPNDWVPRWYQLKPAVGDTRTGGGIMTVIRNDLGSHWIMAHLSSNDEAPVGKRVRKGDVIGKSGNTGSSTGPHLHLGLLPPNPNWGNGQYGAIDPAGFLTEAYAPNKYVSWKGGATSGKGSTSTAPAVAAKPYKLTWDATSNHSGRRPATVKLEGVVVHWWDDPAKKPSLNGVVSWFKNPASQVSAHYVVENGTVVQMVTDDHVAWHAGSKHWNERTIGIECNPRMSPADLETVAQLIADLERKHGPLLVYKHSDVNPGTQCPGTYAAKIGWLVARVNTLKTAAKPTQATAAAAISTSSFGPGANREMEEIMSWYKGGRRDFEAWMERKCRDAINQLMPTIVRNVWGYKNKGVNGDKDAYALLTEMSRRVEALEQKAGK